jgi:small subunit ribosomal protein S3|tara:strand:+ start:7933 stop:8577 length:645 start_codon:yes stop_codon:yes gene_type:complete
MGQKTHPSGFRLGITKTHDSLWYTKPSKYAVLIEEDFKIRELLKREVSNAGLLKVLINRKDHQIELELHTMRPGIIIGRSGTGLQSLRTNLESILREGQQLRLNLVEITQPDSQATIVAEFLCQQLEKRTAFRRAIRQSVQKAQRASVKGVKIQVSGRLNGAEIARSEWVREGQVPLQTLRADIDYASREAHTTYGVLGVKVWFFKGEILKKVY